MRLEFEEILKKNHTPGDGGSLADPKTFKENLTNELRKIVALKHERYLWHKYFLSDQDASKNDLLAKQSAFEKAKQNYEDHIKNIRD